MLLPIVPTKVHGIIDYIGGVVLVALPWVLGISQYSFAPWAFVILGIISILYSLMTRYEAGYVSLITMRMHLWLDVLVGFLLIVSPWAMDFAGYVYMPHVVTGSIIIVLALLTDTKPSYSHGPKLTSPPQERTVLK
jgi:hypothetical protein